MSAASWALQQTIFATLCVSDDVKEAVGDPPRVFDAVPRGAAFPYIVIGDGADPEVFTTVAGLRATQLSFNAQAIDVTNADSADQWRELLAGGGVKTAAISGSGVFKDASSDAALRTAFFNQACANWTVVIPSFGTIAGPFKVTSLSYDGPYDGELKLALSLASAGALTFTAL